MAVRRAAFEAVGGFRPGFGKVGLTSLTEDDTDLCIRIAASRPGGRWVYMPRAIVLHEVPRDRATFTYFLRRCYLEGAGKIHMSRLLGDDSDLGMEYQYLLRVIPAGILRALRETRVARAAAMILGILAAGAGASVGILMGASGPVRELAAAE
jgi:GT2 family glycosyltransferase